MDRQRSIERLPSFGTQLVGRDEDVAAVVSLVLRDDLQFVTLLGPAGVGKTRLAVEAAKHLVDEFTDVVFVSLGAVSDSALVLSAIAQAFGIREVGDRQLEAGLRRVLAETRSLLILDNFEHLIAAVPVVSALLVDHPRIKMLVTSRVSLRISGEQEYVVSPLLLERIGTVNEFDMSPAVRLFVQRATAVRPDFVIDAVSGVPVADICRKLDGLPLAIELAAARSKLFSPVALLARLEQGLQILSGGPRNVPTRQRTLDDAIRWSYDLLADEDRSLFRRLSVFRGGFTIEASAMVARFPGEEPRDDLEGLSTLVDSSLVQQRDGSDGEPRFSMLETIRSFAADELRSSGETETVQRRLAHWILALARQAEPELYGGPNQITWLSRLERDHDNVRVALDWAAQTGESEFAVTLSGTVFWFWYVRGYLTEGRRQLARALAPNNTTPSVARARALLGAGMLAHRQGDASAAQQLLSQSLDMARTCGDPVNSGFALALLGVSAEDAGDYTNAAALFDESLQFAREFDGAYSETLIALTIAHRGVVAWGQGDFAGAISLCNEALARHRACSDSWGIANVLGYLALIRLDQGELSQAANLQRESLALFVAADSIEDIASGLVTAAAIIGARKRYLQATEFFGAAQARLEEIGAKLALPERSLCERILSDTQQALGAARFAVAFAEGRASAPIDILAAALDALEIPEDDFTPQEERSGRQLSPREREVLQLLIAGHSDREIASALFLSPRTVQGHVANIFIKLDVRTRAAAVATGLRLGFATD